MLGLALENAGFRTVAAKVYEMKRGIADFGEFISQYKPDVILYDIAPPYRENWDFLQRVVLTDEAAKDCRFVITTTNKKLVREVAGTDIDVYEVSEKPYEIYALIEAVRRQLKPAA